MKLKVREDAIYLIIAFLTVTACFVYAFTAFSNVNFSAINGTYQNYNVIRRFLAGQVPFHDFTVYLGYGHVLLGSFFTYFFGNNYAASQVAMLFISCLCVYSLFFVTAKAILGNWRPAVVFAGLLIMFRIIAVMATGIDFKIVQEFMSQIYFSVGNSARLVRAFILPLSVIELGGVNFCINFLKNKNWVSSEILAYIKAVLVAVVAGLAFIYGNDYGIAVWVCLTSIFFLVIFTVEKDFLKACLTFVLYLCTSFLTIFFAVLIITSGNFSDWYSAIFDVGTYQKWYYGVNAHSNNYIWNIDTSPICLLAVILAALYIVLLFVNKKNMQYAIGRYGIPAFLNMVACTVANEYKLISGGGLHEVLSIVVWTTLVTELINLILKGISKFQVGTYWVWVKRCGLIFMIMAMITVSINRSLAYHKNIAADKNRSIYVESLGGYLNNGTYSNIVKAAKILNGEAIFSTYASAIEVYTNQFQPTGTDYIIHVLGDSNRDRYLENFKNNNYKYASTINNGYNAWEYWIKNANWFFYRELYKKYCPLYRTSYNVIWKENTAEENCSEEKLDTKVIYNEKSSVTIRVTTKSNITGIADILLKWKVETEDNLASKFIFNPTVHVQCVTSQMFSKSLRDTFNLGKEGTTWVPIQIINGEGEIVLTSNPAENTSLNIIDASADCLYTVENYWLHIKNLKQNNTQCIFILDNNDNNLTALKNTETIKYDSVQYAILGISIDEKNIYLYIDGSAYNNISSKFHENNYLKVEK